MVDPMTLDRDLTAMVTRDRDHPPHLKRYQTATKTRGRTRRSRSDRTAIAARSSRDR